MRTALALFLLTPALAMATPRTLAQQGRLLDTNGPPPNGTVDLDVAIYGAASGGPALFSESFGSVPISGGYYTIILGADTTPLEDDDLDGGARYLGISVNSATEMTPRTPLASVAYAHRADVATRVVGIDDASACTSSNNGAVRFTTATGALDVCAVGAWTEVSGGGTQPTQQTCQDLNDDGSTTSGAYMIDPGGEGPVSLYCEENTGSRKKRAA